MAHLQHTEIADKNRPTGSAWNSELPSSEELRLGFRGEKQENDMTFYNKMIQGSIAVMAPAMLAIAAPASAQEFPLVPGEYSEIGGIYVKDGGTFKYAQFIANEWAKNQEFAKSQGWITDYKIYVNYNPRDGEPNIYLMSTFASLPDAAESEKRSAAYDAWAKKGFAQQAEESGNRAEYRTVKSSMLLQEYTVR